MGRGGKGMDSLPFLVYLFGVVLITATMCLLSHLLNPVPAKEVKHIPFESGVVPVGSTDLRWSVDYFLIAISFVIFDMEAVFLYVWSIVVMNAGWKGFFATTLFVSILLIALFYEWRLGALEWGENKRKQDKKYKAGGGYALGVDKSG